MTITHLNSVAELNSLLAKSSKDKVSVIDFHATWCGPCHAIAPTFESLAKQYKNVNFFKCDVDAAEDVAALYRVSVLPTFIFLRGSSKIDQVRIDQVRGADRSALESAVRRHSSVSADTSWFSGQGRTLGGAAASTAEAVPRQARANLNQVASGFANLDSQFQLFLVLMGGYIMFLYLSGSI